MAQSKYVPGFGSKVSSQPYNPSTGSTSGSVTQLGQTRDIKGPDSEVGDIKLTNNDSPGNAHEHAPGLLEPGEMSWDMIYDSANHYALAQMLGDQNQYMFTETFKDGSGVQAPGYLKKAPIETKTEDQANMVSVTIKLTGKPTYFNSGS